MTLARARAQQVTKSSAGDNMLLQSGATRTTNSGLPSSSSAASSSASLLDERSALRLVLASSGDEKATLAVPINTSSGQVSAATAALAANATRHDNGEQAISARLQNIALAHLLVTHILLWMMKLNSISLFHAGEHQQPQQQQSSQQRQRERSLANSQNGGQTTNSADSEQEQSNPFMVSQQHTNRRLNRTVITQRPANHDGARQTPHQLGSDPSAATSGRRHNGASLTQSTTSTPTTTLHAPPTAAVATLPPTSSPAADTVAAAVNSASEVAAAAAAAATAAAAAAASARADLEAALRRQQQQQQRPTSPMLPPPPISATPMLQQTATINNSTSNNLSSFNMPLPSAKATSVLDQLSVQTKPLMPIQANGSMHSLPVSNVTLPSDVRGERPYRSSGADRDGLSQVIPAPKLPPSSFVDPANNFVLGNGHAQPPRILPVPQQPLGNNLHSLLTSTTSRPKQVASNATTTVKSDAYQFKSSLPKRMTAFRQSNSKNATTTTTLAPLAGLPQLINSNELRKVNNSTDDAKQRARVYITRQQDPPIEDDHADRHNRATTTKHSSTTQRPFPSVESDPPTQSVRPTKETTTSEQEEQAGQQQDGQTQYHNPTNMTISNESDGNSDNLQNVIPVDRHPKAPEDTSANNANDQQEQQDDADQNGDSNEDGEDLDALLPPVPNYNNEPEEEPSQGGATASPRVMRDSSLLQPIAVSSLSGNMSDAQEQSKVAPQPLSEDPFVFNEAASTRSNVSVAMDSYARQPNWIYMDAQHLAMSEPLVGKSRRSLQDATQSRVLNVEDRFSFTEFLNPIVSQYNILVVAILLHLWIDSLRVGSRASSSHKVARQNVAALLKSSGSPLVSSDNSIRQPQLLKDAAASAEHRSKHRRKYEWNVATEIDSSGRYALHRRHHHQQHHRRAKSVTSIHQMLGEADAHSSASSLSRCNSLRSSSSEQLLWVPRARTNAKSRHPEQRHHRRKHSHDNDDIEDEDASIASLASLESRRRELLLAAAASSSSASAGSTTATGELKSQPRPSSSVCSLFFGLLVVCCSLIVILLDIELLSLLVQCLAHLLAAVVCLAGLALVWRNRWSAQQKRALVCSEGSKAPAAAADCHTSGTCQVFHHLFLLAAYFCGMALLLNLCHQHSMQRLFTPAVVAFMDRYQTPARLLGLYREQHGLTIIDYYRVYHLLIAVKGVLLIAQVTLQTILIRASNSTTTRDLRQLHTFLMFANLSLWAMEICEQQPSGAPAASAMQPTQSSIADLNDLARFATSVVTLSHLYHGLVFMQH